MPYPRNPFFTGREEVFAQLEQAFAAGNTAALTQPRALSGLGGVGKTQAAIEYAYRHEKDYRAILWARANTEADLRESFVEIARTLQLPETNASDLSLAVASVKRWLENNTGWLLILDNAYEPNTLRSFLPLRPQGHILLTTRASALGPIAKPVYMDEMPEREGALLLLRRAGLLGEEALFEAATAENQQAALAISREMDGLPLALDQAGAFIEETQSSPADYLKLYRERGKELRAERGELGEREHASVTVTFSLAFQKIADTSPAAADLVCCCAFLAPDAIPEEIFTKGATELGDALGPAASVPLQWQKMLKEACRYSVLQRDPDARTFSVHRLVQEVVKDGKDAETQQVWAERVVRAVNSTFPGVKFTDWALCEHLLPHARVCSTLIDQWNLEFVQAARLLNQTAYYLDERAEYAEAEPLYQRALAIREKALGAEHPSTATSLNNLAALYFSRQDYAAAEPLLRRVVLIMVKALGQKHPDVAVVCENYAVVLQMLGRAEEAKEMLARAQAIREAHKRRNEGS